MELGRRIIYDQDGEIIIDLGEMSGDVSPRKEITELSFIDLEFGSIDHLTHNLVKIDVITSQPILEEIQQVLSPDQQQIKDLEDQILLLTDELAGGIL